MQFLETITWEVAMKMVDPVSTDSPICVSVLRDEMYFY